MPYTVTSEKKEELRGRLQKLPEVVSFKDEPELTSIVACIGLCQEIGTINDEVRPFLFDQKTGQAVQSSEIRSELIEYNGSVGVRIWSANHDHLEFRLKGMKALLNPRFSFRENGSLYQCVLFPATIARLLALQDTELVLVRSWALNTVFGSFEPTKHYYQTNLWELKNNDTLLFAKLLERHRVALLGTHDLVAHVAGVEANAWPELERMATEVRSILEQYFHAIQVPTISSLIMPYIVGVLLDDLAQPPNYGAEGRRLLIDETLRAIESEAIDPLQPRSLLKFPDTYEEIIQLARQDDLGRTRKEAHRIIQKLVTEIQSQSRALLIL